MASLSIQGETVEDRALVFLDPLLSYKQEMRIGALYGILDHESKMGKNVQGAGTASLGRALGPWNVMEAYLSDYGLNSTTVYDPWVSTEKVCAVLLKAHKVMLSLVPEAKNDLPLYAYLLYVAHNAGRGGMTTIINRTLARSQRPITVDDVRPIAAAYVGKTAREPGYYTVAYGDDDERGAQAWEQWAQLALQTYTRPSAWVAPMVLTASSLIVAALATAIYLEATGSRSPWVHWSPSTR